jgi:hypothetical protein
MKTQAPTTALESVRTIGLAVPEVEATANWAGSPVATGRGCFIAGLSSHRSAEPGTLVVRCAVDPTRIVWRGCDTCYLTAVLDFHHGLLVRLIATAAYDVLAFGVATGLSIFKPGRPFRRRGATQMPEVYA